MVRRSAYALAVVAVMCAPNGAMAQAFRSGNTFSLGGTTNPVINPDVAYNPKNNQYLQVSGKTFIEAHVVDAAGAVVGRVVVTDNGNYAQMPRVAYSPDIADGAGGYLVTWHETLGQFARVRGRIFRHDLGTSTPSFDISVVSVSAGTSSCWIMGAATAYSTASHEFLIAWQQNFNTTNDIYFARVNNAGALLPNAAGGVNTLLSAGTPDWERDPSVAYNPDRDEFYVAYAGYLDSGHYGYVAGRRIQAGTGAVLSSPQPFIASGATYLSSVTYNTSAKQYLVGWDNFGAAQQVYGIVLDGTGNPLGPAHAISAYYAAYDALDLDYNIPSGQYLLTTHGKNWEDAAVTVLANGNPYDNGFLATSTTGVSGNFNPMLATSTVEKKWLLVTASAFASTAAQFIATGAAESGGAAPGGASQPPPPCTSALSASSLSPPAAGSMAVITVSGSCSWTASSSAPWITIVSGSSGTGAGTVTLSFARNLTVARSASVTIAGLTVSVTQAGVNVASVAHDLNGDGLSDLLWQNVATGELATWYLSNNKMVGAYRLSPAQVSDLGWRIVGTGDLDGDGLADIVWQHATGYLAVWRMQGPLVLSTHMLNPGYVADLNWKICAVGDINGDGKADLVWRHEPDGALAVWYMNGSDLIAGVIVNGPAVSDMNWKVVGAGDINRDGMADLVWQNRATGSLAAWALNGNQVTGASSLMLDGSPVAVADVNWVIAGVGDVNGNGSADVIWQNTATGQLGVWYLDGVNVLGQYSIIDSSGNAISVTDLNWKVMGPG